MEIQSGWSPICTPLSQSRVLLLHRNTCHIRGDARARLGRSAGWHSAPPDRCRLMDSLTVPVEQPHRHMCVQPRERRLLFDSPLSQLLLAIVSEPVQKRENFDGH